MKEVMMIVGIVLLAVIVGAAVAFRLYWRHNTHWFDKYEKTLKTAGAEEKQVTLPSGKRPDLRLPVRARGRTPARRDRQAVRC